MTTHFLLSAGRGPAECSWAVARLTARLETAPPATASPIHDDLVRGGPVRTERP